MPNLDCKGGWVTWVIWCFTKNLCIRHGAWAGRPIVLLKLPITGCPKLQPSESSESFPQRNSQAQCKFDAKLLLYSLSHFEYESYTVHMLTQQSLLPPLTSTVKSSLFTRVHSHSLSLAARLHQCHANPFCCVNNGWTLSFYKNTPCILSQIDKSILNQANWRWSTKKDIKHQDESAFLPAK